MSKTLLPFAVNDVSALARALGRELGETERKLGHVQLLNILARAAGYRNFQHFRAQVAAGERLETPLPASEPADQVLVERMARHFDAQGRWVRWPAKTSHQQLCLWVLWARLPTDVALSEPEINRLIQAAHLFGDHAILRRELVNTGLVERTPDCKVYRRVERRPPPEALALIRRLDLKGRA
ncbi:DUF2087 domain-containing protein [Phenylobacterium sp.]|uniref:DUF2087 domain-containing protein n=1 Tax=Phenylobacterium sp. TaxID=1871053 RepID=UPI0035B36022